MVAYSFQEQFVDPILVGLGRKPRSPGPYKPKRHTIRADRKRHARPGEELQLYRGMRTRACYLIGKARCTGIKPIALVFKGPSRGVWIDGTRVAAARKDLDAFAESDGFAGWAELNEFWNEEHGDPERWAGVIVYWAPL